MQGLGVLTNTIIHNRKCHIMVPKILGQKAQSNHYSDSERAINNSETY